MKKYLSIILASALIASLVSCGESTSTSSTVTKEKAVPTETTAEVSTTTEVTTTAETTITTTVITTIAETTTIPETTTVTEPPTEPPTPAPTEPPTEPPTPVPTEPPAPVVEEPQPVSFEYWVNTDSGKFHYSDCRTIKNEDDPHWDKRWCDRQELINEGYSPCGVCNP